jgi:hypothetical protein
MLRRCWSLFRRTPFVLPFFQHFFPIRPLHRRHETVKSMSFLWANPFFREFVTAFISWIPAVNRYSLEADLDSNFFQFLDEIKDVLNDFLTGFTSRVRYCL